MIEAPKDMSKNFSMVLIAISFGKWNYFDVHYGINKHSNSYDDYKKYEEQHYIKGSIRRTINRCMEMMKEYTKTNGDYVEKI